MKILEGNAAYLTELLQNLQHPVSAVISSLPLRSLPKTITQKILSEIPKVLSKNGQYIQFTYDIRKEQSFYPKKYRLLRSKIIWRNIPPARVEEYRLNETI